MVMDCEILKQGVALLINYKKNSLHLLVNGVEVKKKEFTISPTVEEYAAFREFSKDFLKNGHTASKSTTTTRGVASN